MIRDDSVGPIHEELGRRSHSLRQSYPFDLKEGTLVYAEDRHSPVYEFLLSARALATPRHVDDYLLREASREAGLVFDRARLVLVASSAGANALDSEIIGRMDDLTALVRDG